MTLTDQLQYYNSAQRDRDRYQVERDVWIKLHRKPEPPKSQRPKKDPNIPKRTRSSFLFYAKAALHQVRLEKPHLNYQDQLQEIARRWRALSDESKEDYREMAQNDKRRYAREIKSYHMQKVELARIQRLEAKNLARQQANQQPSQQEAEPVPQPQAPQPAAPEQPQPQVAQGQQQAGRVRPQPQEVEPQQQAVAPIQPQQQDAPQRPNPHPRHRNP